ncbi:hypothetical protein GMRT_12235 [Giardia muris]|uniref:Uncharacterized protein n=1 Tax=Giardia muris TaxID=5742 RepID=A0A4Z1TDJ2_GIAMU|nr:hypothetical protein GMRT_12235 [Giardia muris]|eukprot:TNJ30611.1 hypothetical protein GMRT_12235 [Giardia muris]
MQIPFRNSGVSSSTAPTFDEARQPLDPAMVTCGTSFNRHTHTAPSLGSAPSQERRHTSMIGRPDTYGLAPDFFTSCRRAPDTTALAQEPFTEASFYKPISRGGRSQSPSAIVQPGGSGFSYGWLKTRDNTKCDRGLGKGLAVSASLYRDNGFGDRPLGRSLSTQNKTRYQGGLNGDLGLSPSTTNRSLTRPSSHRMDVPTQRSIRASSSGYDDIRCRTCQEHAPSGYGCEYAHGVAQTYLDNMNPKYRDAKLSLTASLASRGALLRGTAADACPHCHVTHYKPSEECKAFFDRASSRRALDHNNHWVRPISPRAGPSLAQYSRFASSMRAPGAEYTSPSLRSAYQPDIRSYSSAIGSFVPAGAHSSLTSRGMFGYN